MVTTNPVINELKTLISTKRSEAHEYELKLESLLEDIAAIERTLIIYSSGKPIEEVEHVPKVAAKDLRNMTQMQAIDYIADLNDGVVKVSVARNLIIEAGLSKGQPKYVYGHVYNLIRESNRYEKVGEGEFRRKPYRLPLIDRSHAGTEESDPQNYVTEVVNGYQKETESFPSDRAPKVLHEGRL